MKNPCLLVICALCLVACGESDDGGSPSSTAGAATPDNTEAAPDNHGRRNRAFAMREMEALSKRVCGSVSPEVLARSLEGGAFPKTDTSPNAIALGYARDVDISPIPLQRAAAEGCRAGVGAAPAKSSEASGGGLTTEQEARKAAYRDTYKAAKFTCGGFSRRALSRGFHVDSTEPNDIGLAYSANFDSDVRFSRARAAYNGCLAGMGE